MPGGQFLELLLLKWSDFDNSKIAAGHFTHNYGLDHIFNKKASFITFHTIWQNPSHPYPLIHFCQNQRPLE